MKKDYSNREEKGRKGVVAFRDLEEARAPAESGVNRRKEVSGWVWSKRVQFC